VETFLAKNYQNQLGQSSLAKRSADKYLGTVKNFCFYRCGLLFLRFANNEVHLSNIDLKSKEDGHNLTKTHGVPNLDLAQSLCAVGG